MTADKPTHAGWQAAASKEVKGKGARVLGEPRIGAHGTPIFFVHPKDMGGVLTEIMESPKVAHRSDE
jgi:methylmalonyl-CoA/ethylmalonyl-CoA epimerase